MEVEDAEMEEVSTQQERERMRKGNVRETNK